MLEALLSDFVEKKRLGGTPGEIQDLMERKDFSSVRIKLLDTFSNLDMVTSAFRDTSRADVSVINLLDLTKWYHFVNTFENGVTIVNAIDTLIDHIEHKLQFINKQNMLAIVTILYLPILREPENSMLLLPKLCSILAKLSASDRFEFALVVQESVQSTTKASTEKARIFKVFVQLLQQYLTLQILRNDPDTEGEVHETIVHAVQTLAIFAAINETNSFVPIFEFYNETVEESLELKTDYPKWKAGEGFAFCNYPFLLSTSTKGDILKVESMIQMRHELQDAFFRAMFIGVNNPYLQLEVRRDHVIRDALFQLAGKSNHDLKKQLRVSFANEDGIDEGGIQKEFFQIVAKEMFESTYGLFTINAESRSSWFSYWGDTQEREMLDEYNLLGRLIGLAFYNGVALDVNFAPVLYKKILNVPVGFEDIAGFDPELYEGLKKLMEYEGDVENVYCRTFAVDAVTPLGKKFTIDLIPNGSLVPVTNDNREDFVEKYVDFLFNTSISKPYAAFEEGLKCVLDGSGISLFRPEELQELICGSPSLDFAVLEESTIYDGYTAESPVIRFFWEIVKEFSDDQKRQLLVFATGSDRVPIGGLGKLQFVIAKNGGDSERLPTSHTCFNALLLCEYSSKEKLKDRLLVALENRNCGFYLN